MCGAESGEVGGSDGSKTKQLKIEYIYVEF